MILLSKINPRGIIWIASYPRSGNTWTRAFINNLIHILRNPDHAEIDINRVEPWTASELNTEHYSRFLKRPGHNALPSEIAAIRPRVQAEIARQAAGPIYVKTHNANALDHGHPLVNMAATAGTVYLVRNPLDVAISLSHYGSLSIDRAIDNMATPGFGINSTRNYIRMVWGSWSENVGSWAGRPTPATLVTRYEDLVATPHDSFAAIARHLTLKPTPDQIERAVAMIRFERLKEKEATGGFVEKPNYTDQFFREGRVGQWRERLSEEQVARVVKAHHPLMRRFGYLPEQAG
jgi:Sulfotransferase domain